MRPTRVRNGFRFLCRCICAGRCSGNGVGSRRGSCVCTVVFILPNSGATFPFFRQLVFGRVYPDDGNDANRGSDDIVQDGTTSQRAECLGRTGEGALLQ